MTRTKKTITPASAANAVRARDREWVLRDVPAELRQQVDRWASDWLRTKFHRFLELRAADPGPFNYPVEVFSEWRGKAFYLCVRYRTGKGRPPGDFVVRSTRLTMTGFGRFELAYSPSHQAVVHGLSRPDSHRVLSGDRRERGLLAGHVTWPAS